MPSPSDTDTTTSPTRDVTRVEETAESPESEDSEEDVSMEEGDVGKSPTVHRGKEDRRRGLKIMSLTRLVVSIIFIIFFLLELSIFGTIESSNL